MNILLCCSQLICMPPDRSVEFDFTRRGFLVFDADHHSLTNGNLYVMYNNNNLPASAMPPLIPEFEVDEFSSIIQGMAKVRKLYCHFTNVIGVELVLGFSWFALVPKVSQVCLK